MSTKTEPPITVYETVAPPVTDTAIERKDFRAQQSAERLAENTVASMDDQMQTFHFSKNSFRDNMMWAETQSYRSELSGYDADYSMRSPAALPGNSPDNG